MNVVRAARATGVERILYFQTALCYGTTPTEQPVTLSHPIRPDSSYGISKTAGEQYIELSGLDFVSFRLANAYGPRNISGPLPTFYHRLTEGKPVFVMDTRRDFIYVDDLIDVVVQAVVEGTGHRHYHVSSGSDFAIKELFDATIAALPEVELDEAVEVRPKGEDDAYTILLDPSRIREDFGWEPKTLARGRRAASHRVLPRVRHLADLHPPEGRRVSAAAFDGSRILVVGGAGFVGSNLVRAAARAARRARCSSSTTCSRPSARTSRTIRACA